MGNQGREQDEFYVGYLPQAPADLARRLRLVVGLLLILIAAIAVLLVSRQQPLGEGRYEFGIERHFDGVLRERPVPLLITAERTYLLSDFGKRGAAEHVAGRNGMPTRLVGTLVERDDRAMIEVHEVLDLSTEEFTAFKFDADAGVSLGRQSFEGEIVDSKCYLGAMKPGHTKPHRGCAVRCISGGIPPLLLVVDLQGGTRELLLASADGEMVNEAVLPYVAEQIVISGELTQRDGVEILFIDPAEIQRIKK
jgi:hypothetical protein